MIYTFLILFTLLAVIRTVVKILKNRVHITGPEFREYMNSGRQMSNDERSRITSHIGICDKCQSQVEEWIKGDNLEDSLIED